MVITTDDISLQKFLDNFTFTNEVGKMQISVDTWLNTASLLRVAIELERLQRR